MRKTEIKKSTTPDLIYDFIQTNELISLNYRLEKTFFRSSIRNDSARADNTRSHKKTIVLIFSRLTSVDRDFLYPLVNAFYFTAYNAVFRVSTAF